MKLEKYRHPFIFYGVAVLVPRTLWFIGAGISHSPLEFLMLIAPALEEFGWHTYGTHCVRRRFNLFTSCFIFGIIWGIWHMPLSFIKGYYQSVLAETGILYSINFMVSLIPYLIIDNWQYYKVKRNMGLQIGQHLAFGYSMEIFRTHPDSKLIHTVLLCIFSAVIVLREKKFFFDKRFDEAEIK